MLLYILIAAAALIAVLLIIVALQPTDYRVTRSASVAAPPPAVFAQVNDFHRWAAWNPWGKLDPAMKESYAGAPAGVGAVYAWAGNGNVGEGRMTIVESRPSDRIGIKLEFLKPFASVCAAEFTFEPQGDRTVVTWTMTGRNNFIAKAMHLVMNMDKMIGGQFEKGLASIRAIVEAGS